MKHRIYPKLLLSYLLYGIIAFAVIFIFAEKATNAYLIDNEKQQLYREAAMLSSNYAAKYYSKVLAPEELHSQLSSISNYLDAEIWMVDPSGVLVLDEGERTIEGFDIGDFGSRYYMIGTFYQMFSEDYLTVFSPITVGYQVRGYILLHKKISTIIGIANGLLNITFYTVGIVFLCSFIVLLFFTFLVYWPIRKITKVAGDYAKGEFDKTIAIRSNDEIGYLANTLNYMAKELGTLEEDQRKFISNVSHDFRSPLTSIKGYVEAMLDGTIPVELQEKYLNIILFETNRLTKLTQSLIDLNRFGHHGIMLDIADFDINNMIRTTILTFEGKCMEKGVSFDLLLTGQELLVTGDMSKIQQVLYNLIDNAVKFSNNNSSIQIETSIKNEKVFISVKDSGIGIPADSIKKIWERFYKTDLSRGKDKRGTGLGLSIVKEIIQAHKENINVISTEGVGTEFVFSLPLSQKDSYLQKQESSRGNHNTP